MWSYAVDTGTTRRITECGDAAAWTQDGRRIVCQRSGHLVVVDVSSGRTKELLTPGLAPGGVRLAAGDSQLFFLTGAASADIWIARFGQPGKPQ